MHPMLNFCKSSFHRFLVTLGDNFCKRSAMVFLLALPPTLFVARGPADVLLVLIGVAFLFESVHKRRWQWLQDPVVVAGLVFWIFLNTVVSPFAEDSDRSFSRSLPWVRFPLFYAAVASWLLTEIHALRLATWCLAGVLGLVVADCLVQAVSGTSIMGDPIHNQRLLTLMGDKTVGSYIAKFGFPLVGMLICLDRFGVPQGPVVATILGPLMLLAVVLTNERTATVLTLFSLLLIGVFVFAAVPSRRALTLLIASALTGLISVIILFVDRVNDRAIRFIELLIQFDQSSYYGIFKMSWHIFLDHPLTGIGLKNYRDVRWEYVDLAQMPVGGMHPHNVWLEVLAETGLFGFAAFVGLVTVLIIVFARRAIDNRINSLGTGFLASSFVITLFPIAATQSFFSNWPAILLWCSFTFAMATVSCRMPTALGTGRCDDS